MRRKRSLFFIVIIINCCIIGIEKVVPDGEYADIIANKITGCIVAEAADVEDINETTENIVSDKKIGDKKLFEESETETKHASTGNTEQVELINDEIEEAEEVENIKEESSCSEKEQEEDKESNCIYNVSFPTNSKAYLDPENLSGKGQVFSEEFRVENYGNTDVTIKIKSIEVYFRQREEMYELSAGKVTDDYSDIKKLNVDVVWKNKNTENVLNVVEGVSDEEILFLEAGEFDENGNFIDLKESSIGSFYFTGTLNSNPKLDWEDGEVTISFDYEIVNTEEKNIEEIEEELEKNNVEQEEIIDEEEFKEETIVEEEQIREKDEESEEEFDKEKQAGEENTEETDVNNEEENLEEKDVYSAVKKTE